ncbi:MAG: metallophosphatase domain-containing protein [Microscillaceae bacterium]|nr:metallophosphatase domain-containing protein [Microscillaceae bacterium]
MKIVCISDTHSGHHAVEIPEGDILIHAGDLTAWGKSSEIKEFNDWLGTLPHPHKIVICGNHDWFFEQSPKEAAQLISNAIFLMDSGVDVMGLKIWGSPITPRFFSFAFNRDRGEDIQKHWDMIPTDTDLLITHGPPFGILDRNFRGEWVGCEALRQKVDEISPRMHVFGHIHEAYGLLETEKTIFVNASIMNLEYHPVHQAILVEV